ncbi:MAG: lipid-binding SYLF domain-containing protein [Candidatus Omnitrophica bacterium]|nr:lipid-binding SYLF domain-containing protein [Candidatus Omnitrophota bacterium]
MNRLSITVLVLACFVCVSVSPVQAGFGWDPRKQDKLAESCDRAIQTFKEKDPELKDFFDKAYGYAVFPTVGKAGIGIGGAHGSGLVYVNHTPVGRTSLTQLSIGWQLGGQAYSEIIFFKDKTSFDYFKNENFELGAQVSAVAVTMGASADADYSGGVAVFTMAKGGLMYEASVGGQKFTYRPLEM